MPVPCARCKRPMSPTAVVCPHCGARQADRDPIEAHLKARATEADPYRGEPAPSGPRAAAEPMSLSPEEARALTEVTLGARRLDAGPRIGAWALLLPSEGARGAARWAEIGLTLLAAPIVLLAFAMLLFQPRLWRRVARGEEWALTALCVVLGGVAIAGAGALAPSNETLTWLVGGTSCLALVARTALRGLAR